MPKNVMKLAKPSPNLGRNAFDMSYRSLYSANFGELLPAYVQETVPNDKIIIRPANLIRALPMVTSPFLRAKQHIDFWFVPYSALWSRFNEWLVNRSEPNSSALKDKNYLPHFNLQALVTAVGTRTWDDVIPKDVVGREWSKGALKLLDMLGYPTGSHLYGGRIPGSYECNPFRLAAYNFIWYKEYRQKYYDDGSHLCNFFSPADAQGKNVSALWNYDYLDCDTFANADIWYNDEDWPTYLLASCQMRYRLWKKDLFTGLMPSTQFGSVSSVGFTFSGLTGSDVNQWGTTDGSDWQANKQVFTKSTSGTLRTSNTDSSPQKDIFHTHNFSSGSGFDVLALRKAEALQRWRENALRAGNQIEDNFEAHYGSKPKSHMITHPTFIGSYDAPLNIGDVDATAEVGTGVNQQLASVAGKGISSMDSREFTFETNDFGVIIGMWSMLPEAEYNALGINRMNALLEREDFFFPEFENLGLAPVDGSNFLASTSSGLLPNVLGYAPRYWEYKQRFDEVHNSFMSFGSNDVTTGGNYRFWASPKFDVVQALDAGSGQVSVLPLSCLYVDPRLFDVNFGVNVDKVVDGVEVGSDQFLVDFYFKSTALRSMSVSGMPSYSSTM